MMGVNTNLIISSYEELPEKMRCPYVHNLFRCEEEMKQIHKTKTHAVYQCTGHHCHQYTRAYNYREEDKLWWREGDEPFIPSELGKRIDDIGAAVLVVICILIAGIIVVKFIWYVLPVILGVGTLLLIIFQGENIMKAIKNLLGLNVLKMKLDAMAKHLKLKFTHIPEHYKCEPNKITKPKSHRTTTKKTS
jgi:hypothetical protein